ncbi:ABC transporter ATP-binding protein [Mesorhizobium sp. L48C026A00]|uniref:ABC transporter ATP-binding protein n=1 Tax=Mesorhizobium sp. L48C026A00 TaxID=1287182 RepID=UPI0003D01290|nr:ABC transporter ATP-binding protein [Mesorhizobium sp. L48C026A00]ESZ02232.1 spermidine/putrescine ABC transporter ATP-binding protein [Mesorhizobium sp. L48C026A00]
MLALSQPAQPQTANRRLAVQAIGLNKRYGTGTSTFLALDDVSIDITENEFFTLLGPSGCGKTTLLRLIAGFSFPTEGQILLHGKDIAPLPPFKRPINTVFQNYALFTHMSVAENIGFGLKMLGWTKPLIAERVAEMLKLVRMESLADRRTSEISGGQQQRVALARALAPQPQVLLLDEPLSALDYKLRKEMQVELKRLQTETGITFIFVTHDQEEALAMSDRIAVMNRGRVLQVGRPKEIYNAPVDRFVADFIGESNILHGRLAGPAGADGHRVDITGTVITAYSSAAITDAGSVQVLIRPEHVDVLDAPSADSIPAVIEDEVFVGTDTRLQLRLNDGSIFTARLTNSPEREKVRAPGTQVWLRIHGHSARLLGGEYVEHR